MSRPRPYHHGDLRAALVQAGLAVVERDGYEAVSLRELARSLGVSSTAPYRHFADRRALLGAIAAEGFRQLTARYDAILGQDMEASAKARAFHRAFLDMAKDRPGLFGLMFESDLLAGDNLPAELVGKARAPLAPLWQVIQAARPELDATQVRARAIAVWSTLHGFAALRRSGKIKGFMIEPLSFEALTETVLDFVTA